jgi:hypothetical protein
MIGVLLTKLLWFSARKDAEAQRFIFLFWLLARKDAKAQSLYLILHVF